MKVFAVIPALMVLVSLCGSPVPPPPGTVSGNVYYDANRNGVRDTCDSPLRASVVVTGPSGKTATVDTDATGSFYINDAPAGDGQVSLYAAPDTLWPFTNLPDGQTGFSVHVESGKTVSGVDMGAANRIPFSRDKTSVSGIIFYDENGNGTVDREECPASNATNVVTIAVGSRSAVLTANGTFQINDLADSESPVVKVTFPLTGFAPIGSAVKPLIATAGRTHAEPVVERPGTCNGCVPEQTQCAVDVDAVRRYGPNVYEANIGFAQRKTGRGMIKGVAYDDANGNGVRDTDEGTVAGASIAVAPVEGTSCVPGSGGTSFVTEPFGGFVVGGLAPGTYTATVLGAILNGESVVSQGWPESLRIDVRDNSPTQIELPVKLQPAAYVKLLAFDDQDGDGLSDSGEPAVEGLSACLTPEGFDFDSPIIPFAPDYSYYPLCTLPDGDVTNRLGPLAPGDYEVTFFWRRGDSPNPPANQALALEPGQTLELEVPVDIQTPQEDVIAPGEGEVLTVDTCYSDPAWAQPPFTYADYYFGLGGFDEVTAAKVYAHGIYPISSIEEGFWQATAQLQWLKAPPGCGSYTFGEVFVLAGYEPIAVTQNGAVVQVVLRRNGYGLYALSLARDERPGEQLRALFVDENYDPIVRCSANLICDWNDGTLEWGYGYIN